MSVRFRFCLLAALLMRAHPAFAQVAAAPPPDSVPEVSRERARAHYRLGVNHAREGRYEKAVEEFVAAYQSRPHFEVLYNIGQAYLALVDWRKR